MQMVGLAGLEANADEAARFLKLLANEQRLLILCHLVENREMSVTALADAVGLSQSALSQHLARLRADGLVTNRRQAQTLHYRVADPRAVRLLKTLKQTFCP
jgi:ArsR family transcriptional regulator, virulence genes transcriptional regulator